VYIHVYHNFFNGHERWFQSNLLMLLTLVIRTNGKTADGLSCLSSYRGCKMLDPHRHKSHTVQRASRPSTSLAYHLLPAITLPPEPPHHSNCSRAYLHPARVLGYGSSDRSAPARDTRRRTNASYRASLVNLDYPPFI